MELHAVELARLVRHGGVRNAAGESRGDKAVGKFFDAIAVTHPHIEQRPALFVSVIAQAVEQPARRRSCDLCVAEFAMIRRTDPTAELLRHGLHAVADAQHGNAQFKHRLRRGWRLGSGHRLRAARQDHAPGLKLADVLVRHVPGMDLAIDPALAHAARDQLGVLRTEVEDENAMRVDIRKRSRRGGARLSFHRDDIDRWTVAGNQLATQRTSDQLTR